MFWIVSIFAPLQEAQAIPAFARKHDTSCSTCHVLPPKLNAFGEAFLARGYRMPEGWRKQLPDSAESMAASTGVSVSHQTPQEGKGQTTDATNIKAESKLAKTGAAISHYVAAWVSGRYENSESRFSKGYLNRVEIISAGHIGDSPFSYFVEWRAVSLETRNDGSLRDRSGRFEDALVNVDINNRNSLTFGQYRSLRQVDVSRRLTITEPAIFSTSLAGDPSGNTRLQSLRAFAPSGRSAGLTYQFRSILGERPSDGLFHLVTVPVASEFSLPLTSEARREASFQLEGRPKGIFLESFYRKGLNSVGAHAFLDDDRRLFQGVGTLNYKRFYATGGLGIDQRDTSSRRQSRARYSLEGEYLATRSESLRSMLGLRVEQITNANRKPAYIPYFVVSGPNRKGTFSLAVQYRAQKDNNAIFSEFSIIF
ncbi:MAG: hypothetical protein H0T92_24590 [Pyrinomonadaceae bacterium]|nr:hypothetical protein [Pyrinomonadaceae bacterium]